jgi:Ca2+:H+ antiporter
MRDANGMGYSQHYSSANGQLWSLQSMLALATSFATHVVAGSDSERAPRALFISRGAAPVMLVLHVQWFYFRYHTHRRLFEDDITNYDTENPRSEETPQPVEQAILPWRSLSLLSWTLVISCLVLGMATGISIVKTTEGFAQTIHMSKTAVGLTLLPLVGITPTMFEALRAAAGNRMDLALRLTLQSSIDTAYLAFPALVLAAWWAGKSMLMDFDYLIVELGVSVWLIGRIFSSGKSTYLDGATVLSLYVIRSMIAAEVIRVLTLCHRYFILLLTNIILT